MKEKDLLPGDLIFSVDSLGLPEHVSIYLDRKYGQPFISHATDGRYKCMMNTRLTPADPGCHYHVYRSRNFRFSLLALYYMNSWVDLQIKYDPKKYDQLTFLLETNRDAYNIDKGGAVHLALATQKYETALQTYVRMVQRNELPFPVGPRGITEGMFCSEAIVYAFNLAYLNFFNVKAPTHSPRSQIRYQSEIQRMKHLDINPMPLSGRHSTPWAMETFAKSHPELWNNLGKLEITPAKLTEKEIAVKKSEWREYVLSLKCKALAKHFQLLQIEEGKMKAPSKSEDVNSAKNFMTGKQISMRRINIFGSPTKKKKTRAVTVHQQRKRKLLAPERITEHKKETNFSKKGRDAVLFYQTRSKAEQYRVTLIYGTPTKKRIVSTRSRKTPDAKLSF